MAGRRRTLPNTPDEDGPTLDRVIEEAIVRDIIAWRYEPGSWIRERQIAERFQCSHGPVREAFRNLSREGFLEVVPWRGARVVELDAAAVNDIFELWRCLYGLVCRFTAARITPEDARELDRLQRHYESVVRSSSSTRDHIAASWPIGTFVSDRCGSPLAQEQLLRVARLARWCHKLLDHDEVARFQPRLGLEGAMLYRKAIDAIIDGRGEDAERFACEFLGHTQHNIGRVLAAQAAEMNANKPKKRRR